MSGAAEPAGQTDRVGQADSAGQTDGAGQTDSVGQTDHGITGSLTAEDMAYRARALAQAHPLTHLARQLVDRSVAQQRMNQPVPEIGIWAGAAAIGGYCLRRVEESEVGLDLRPAEEALLPDLDTLDDTTARIAADLRTEGAGGHMLADEDRNVDALDRIIASEVSRRLDHWKDDVDEAAWAELEEYLTWWVVKGYALRTAERATGALR